jgi:hypothetical protein
MNLIKGRLMAIKEDLIAIENDLVIFRKTHKLSDDQFSRKFNMGELDDAEDFLLWEGSLQLRESLRTEERLLRAIF